MKNQDNKNGMTRVIQGPSNSYTGGTMQLELMCTPSSVVHYFDGSGALHSGRLVRRIEKGENKGMVVVSDYEGKQFMPDRIRNIE